MSRAKVTKYNNMSELGTQGLKHWSGRVDEEWLAQLKGPRFTKVIKEMRDNDPIIGAILFAVDMLIRQVHWKVEPYSDSQKDKDNAEFLESCMEDMNISWSNLMSEILSFLPFGWSYHELVYKKRLGQKQSGKTSKYNDGKWGWRKIPIRAQETLYEWDLDPQGDVKGMWQWDMFSMSQTEKVLIPLEKALLFRTTSHKGNPQGRSILRNAVRPWTFKKRIEEIEGIGIERDLAGLPVMRVPAKIMSSAATAAEQAIYQTCKDIVQNIRRDEQEGIIIPGDTDESGNQIYDLSLLSTGGQRQFDTNMIVGRYDQRIAMVVLADFVLLGHEKVGSFALSDNKTNLFATALAAWLNEIKSVFNRHAIPRLFALNGEDLNALPELHHGDLETPDLNLLGNYIKNLAGAGMDLFPDGDLENHLRRAATLPRKPEIIEDLEEESRITAAQTAAAQTEAAARQQQQQDAAPAAPTAAEQTPGGQTPPPMPQQQNSTGQPSAQNQPPPAPATTKKVYNGSCRFCQREAQKGVVWADGRGVIKACSDHVDKATRHVSRIGGNISKIVDL